MGKIRVTILQTTNEINSRKVGVPYEGDFVGVPQVGRQFFMANVSQGERQSTNVFKTSPVIEIIQEDVFRTENTVYRWVKI